MTGQGYYAVPDAVTAKTCRRCGETKPCSDFYTDSRNSDGLRGRCRECTARGERERYAANPDLYRANCRERAARWRAATPEEWHAALVAIDSVRTRRGHLPDGLEHVAHRIAIELSSALRAANSVGVEALGSAGPTVGASESVAPRPDSASDMAAVGPAEFSPKRRGW